MKAVKQRKKAYSREVRMLAEELSRTGCRPAEIANKIKSRTGYEVSKSTIYTWLRNVEGAKHRVVSVNTGEIRRIAEGLSRTGYNVNEIAIEIQSQTGRTFAKSTIWNWLKNIDGAKHRVHRIHTKETMEYVKKLGCIGYTYKEISRRASEKFDYLVCYACVREWLLEAGIRDESARSRYENSVIKQETLELIDTGKKCSQARELINQKYEITLTVQTIYKWINEKRCASKKHG